MVTMLCTFYCNKKKIKRKTEWTEETKKEWLMRQEENQEKVGAKQRKKEIIVQDYRLLGGQAG